MTGNPLHAAYAGFSDEALAKLASPGLLRRAQADLASGQGRQEAGDFIFALDGQVARLTPAGIEKSRCTCPSSALCRHRLAAILALRGLAPPESSAAPIVPAPAKPKPATKPAVTEPADTAWLAKVLAGLEQVFAAGFSVNPERLEDELRALAAASRAAALPFLTGQLSGIAEGLAQARRRDPAYDAAALLLQVAEAAASCVSILARVDPGAGPSGPRALPPLNLIGIGAVHWQRATGAHGVTAYFYDAGARALRHASLARAHRFDGRFDPAGAYRQDAVWGETLARLAGQQFTLEAGSGDARGRLAVTGDARARAIQPWPDDVAAIEQWPIAFDDWQRLQAWLIEALAPAGAWGRAVVILRPSRSAPLEFDDLTGQTRWPLRDSAKRWLGLTLAADRLGARRATVLADATSVGRPWAVVAEAAIAGDRIEISPFALIGGGLTQLDFPGKAQTRTNDQRAPLGKPRFGPRAASAATALLLDDALAEILRVAEQADALSAAESQDIAARLAARLGMAELQPLARICGALNGPSPAGWLRAAYAIACAQRLRAAIPLLRPV